MTAGSRPRAPLAALRHVVRTRPAHRAGERCDMCATSTGAEHPHVVDLESRALLCACQPCALLFADGSARQRYRTVPRRYLSLRRPALDDRAWDELQIPVGLAFLFHNSAQDRTVAFYPGPAGATESALPLRAWARAVRRNPELSLPWPDVEALLVRRSDGSCHLVPIDACYELVGRIRGVWRGFDGGQQAREAMDAFFAEVGARSRPAPPVPARSREPRPRPPRGPR
ncbi:DUF5947 family protein [Phytohabitans suffuscus]|uniref:Uncharacterized protein n=1 Tax=Phytohabitans suffuscus TaxID=624315 RepID=A0A6F8Z0R0_9ACTN|nr:DUF5947 family protein [Phytohabitans suffuscus]BCB91906.1 hypothetical protein Psuf_092190 [Phytohabitans suffuscus]